MLYVVSMIRARHSQNIRVYLELINQNSNRVELIILILALHVQMRDLAVAVAAGSM